MKKIFLLFAIFLMAASCGKQEPQNQTPPPPPQAALPAPSPAPKEEEEVVLSEFRSDFLGVSFKYNAKKVAVKVDGNIIYIDTVQNAAKGKFYGNHLEVFNKNSNESLTAAIWKHALIEFSESQCKVNISKDYQPLKGFTVASVVPTTTDGYNYYTGSCSSKYINAGAPGFFIYDASHPSVFLFTHGGSAIGDREVLETLKIFAK